MIFNVSLYRQIRTYQAHSKLVLMPFNCSAPIYCLESLQDYMSSGSTILLLKARGWERGLANIWKFKVFYTKLSRTNLGNGWLCSQLRSEVHDNSKLGRGAEDSQDDHGKCATPPLSPVMPPLYMS